MFTPIEASESDASITSAGATGVAHSISIPFLTSFPSTITSHPPSARHSPTTLKSRNMQQLTHHSRRTRVKALFSKIFSPRQPITPGTPECPPEGGSHKFSHRLIELNGNPATGVGINLLPSARDFVINNSPITVQSSQGDRDIVTQGKMPGMGVIARLTFYRDEGTF